MYQKYHFIPMSSKGLYRYCRKSSVLSYLIRFLPVCCVVTRCKVKEVLFKPDEVFSAIACLIGEENVNGTKTRIAANEYWPR